MRFLNALRIDVKFQYKQGFYAIYAVITIFYMIALSWLPEDIKKIVVPIIIFSDPSVLGLFFVGSIVMLEKGQGILQSLVVTPMRIGEYMLAKIVSLTLLAVLAGVMIVVMTTIDPVNWFILIIGIVMTSTLFTLCGFLISVVVRRLTNIL